MHASVSKCTLLVFCAIAIAALLAHCSSDTAGDGTLDAATGQGGRDAGGSTVTCKSKVDCQLGEDCKGGKCVAGSGGGDDGAQDGSLPNGDGEDCTAGTVCGAGYRCNLQTKACDPASSLAADPATLDFGAVPYNGTVKRTLTVSNAGAAELQVLGIEFDQGTNPDPQNPIFTMVVSKSIPAILAPKAYLTADVTYRQDDAKPDIGSLLVTSTDVDHPLTRVPLKSTYKGAPDLAVVDRSQTPPAVLYPKGSVSDDYTVDLGNVALGDTKKVTVTFINTTGGDAILSFDDMKTHQISANAFTATFTNPVDPQKTYTVPLFIGASDMVDLVIDYAPTLKAEDEQTDLDLYTNDDDINNDGNTGGNILYLKLRAKAGWLPPGLSVSKAAVDFGEVQVNSVKTEKLKLCNTGSANLSIQGTSGLQLAGTDFTVDPVDLTMALAPAGCAEVTVGYAPKALGKSANNLVLDSDDPANPRVLVPLAGTGTNPTIAVDPPSIDFGDVVLGVAATPVKVTVKNTGVGSLSVDAIDLTQGSAADYTIVGKPALPATLLENQGNSLEFTVAFTPGLVGSGIAGAVQLDNGDNKAPHLTVPLTGNGVDKKADGEQCNVDGDCSSTHCCTGLCSSWKSVTDCGGCGVPCARDHAAALCDTGVCHIGTCDSGYSSCDGNDANGCERALAGYPAGNTCNNPESAGESCGDERWWTVTGGCHTAQWNATPFTTKTGTQSQWFTAKGLNCITIWCTGPVHNLVQLSVPVGVEYDLCIYTQGVCSSPTCYHATSAAPATATVTAGKDEVDYPYTVEVRFASGSSCDPWTISFTGVLQD